MKRIPFSARMVREILAGRKTVTRRVAGHFPAGTVFGPIDWTARLPDGSVQWAKPPIQVGDRLGVCERLVRTPAGERELPDVVRYAADDAETSVPWRWKVRSLPPRYCPNDLVRIELVVRKVGFELLGTMVDEDAVEEGVENVEEFRALWNELHGPGSFELDPLVFVYRFERVAGQIVPGLAR